MLREGGFREEGRRQRISIVFVCVQCVCQGGVARYSHMTVFGGRQKKTSIHVTQVGAYLLFW